MLPEGSKIDRFISPKKKKKTLNKALNNYLNGGKSKGLIYPLVQA